MIYNPSSKGFTIIELLIVIGVLAILTSVTVLVLNPAERLRQARDATRIVDLRSINEALKYFDLYGGGSHGSSGVVYVSLPDTALSGTATSTCPNMNLPSLSGGWSYQCVSNDNLRKVNGLGWIPVNLAGLPPGSPLAALPVDPENVALGGLYYTYTTGSWELTAVMESEKYGGAGSTAATDGGTAASLFEIGSDIALTPSQSEGRKTYSLTSSSVSQTLDSDFTAGSHSSTAVSGSGSAASVKLATYDDDFSDGSKGSTWDYLGSSSNVSESGGTLNAVLSSGVTGTGGYAFSQAALSGDFDAQVDFSNFSYSGSGNTEAWIEFIIDGDNKFYIGRGQDGATGRIRRYAVISGIAQTISDISASPASGKFRLNRAGSVMTAYYDTGNGWQSYQWTSVPSSAGKARIYLNQYSTGSSVSIKFDNFAVTQGGAAVYVPSGTFTSSVIDTGQSSTFTTLGYTATTPSGTSLTVDVRAGDTASPDGTWTSWQTGIASGGSISALGAKRYIQYRANLATTNSANTSSLDDITINFTY